MRGLFLSLSFQAQLELRPGHGASLVFPLLAFGLLSAGEYERAPAACFASPSFRIGSRFPPRAVFQFLHSPGRTSTQSKPGVSSAAEVRANPGQEVGDRTLEVRDGAQTISFRSPGDGTEVFGKAGKHPGHISPSILGLLLQVMDQSLARALPSQDLIPQSSQVVG
jgi:hypothetical protein